MNGYRRSKIEKKLIGLQAQGFEYVSISDVLKWIYNFKLESRR